MKQLITIILILLSFTGFSQNPDSVRTIVERFNKVVIPVKTILPYYTTPRVGIPLYSLAVTSDGTVVNDTIYRSKVVTEGDSWTMPVTDTWVNYLGDSSSYFARMQYVNYAVGGETTTGMVAQYATEGATQKPTANTDDYWFMCMGGVNDILASTSAATSFSNLKTVFASARNDRYRTIAFTIPKLGGLTGPQETIRLTLNDSILSNYTLFDHVVDVDKYFDYTADPSLWANATHLNTNGQKKLASIIGNIIYSPSNNSSVDTSLLVHKAGSETITGVKSFSENVLIKGAAFGKGNGSGGANLAMGNNALGTNTTGDGNVAIGGSALQFSNGDNNVAIGSSAMYSGGIASIAIGGNSFLFDVTTNSIGIGNSVNAAGTTNEIVIGDTAMGVGNHSVVLGNDNITKTILKGSLGLGTRNPNTTAIMDLTSTTKGVLIPRLTTSEMNAISSPANGLIITNTDSLNRLFIYNGSAWKGLSFTNEYGGGGSYTAGAGLVLQGSQFKLQDTLNGAGTKLIWMVTKGAFRVGNVSGTHWDEANIGYYSTAFGKDTKANGGRSFAVGEGTLSSGQSSTAVGYFTTSSGFSSFANGNYTTASGAQSFATGNTGTTASGTASVATGESSIASGDRSFASGNGNTSSGQNSVSFGGGNTSSGATSFSFGIGLKSKHYNGFVIGNYNDSSNATNVNSFNTANKVFQIGIGVDAFSRTNGMEMLYSGKTTLNKYGVGTFTGTPATYPAFDANGNIIESLTPYGGGGSYVNISDSASMLAPYVTIEEVRKEISDSSIEIGVTTPMRFSANTLSMTQAGITDSGWITPTNYSNWQAKEDGLGLPSLTNYILRSSTAGVRTWIDPLTTTLNGMVKGNGSLYSVATAGTDYVTPTGTETLTNKRITQKVTTITSNATPTPDGDASDMFTVTALAVGATFSAPTGTPTDGQGLLIRVKDNGTARTLAWNAIYRAGTDFALPTTTVISKTMYVQFIYNSADSKWDCTGISQGF